jgi:capsular exopolysaccharide synthesis family protein
MSRTWDILRKSDLFAENPQVPSIAQEPGATEIRARSVRIGPEAEGLLREERRGVMADRLRFLRAHLRSFWSEEKLKCLLITSAAPNDGKSTVALNLAVTLAEGGNRKVLLIEGDMHHPRITQRLGLEFQQTIGLSDCLERKAEPGEVVLKIDPLEIYFLPAGNAGKHPTELLQSDALAGLLRTVRKQFDWVVVDSPPVQPLSDALLLRQQTDATLLVVRSGSTSGSAVENAVSLLGKKSILGMVLNGVEGLERQYSKYYKAYGSYDSE